MAKYKWHKHRKLSFTKMHDWIPNRLRGIYTDNVWIDESPRFQQDIRGHWLEPALPPAPSLQVHNQIVLDSLQQEIRDRLSSSITDFNGRGAAVAHGQTELCLDDLMNRNLISDYNEVRTTVDGTTLNIEMNVRLPQSLETFEIRAVINGQT